MREMRAWGERAVGRGGGGVGGESGSLRESERGSKQGQHVSPGPEGCVGEQRPPVASVRAQCRAGEGGGRGSDSRAREGVRLRLSHRSPLSRGVDG